MTIFKMWYLELPLCGRNLSSKYRDVRVQMLYRDAIDYSFSKTYSLDVLD